MDCKRRVFAATVAMMALSGCGDHEPDRTPATAEIARSHERVVQTPAQTTYEGEGKLVYRKVDAWRVASPFGKSAGDVAAAQQPMTVSEGRSPGVNVAPTGAATTATGGGGDWSSGGFKVTLWDRIKGFFRKLKWLGILGAVAMVALWAIPYTRPVAQAILRFLASLVPLIGSAIEWIIGRVKAGAEAAKAEIVKQQFTEVVKGGQGFKEAVKGMSDLTDAQKAYILSAFKSAQAAAQDKSTQAAVSVAKTA